MKKDKQDKSPGQVDLPPKNTRLCQLYQQLSEFASNLDRLPEAQEAGRDKPMAVPQEALPMVF